MIVFVVVVGVDRESCDKAAGLRSEESGGLEADEQEKSTESQETL